MVTIWVGRLKLRRLLAVTGCQVVYRMEYSDLFLRLPYIHCVFHGSRIVERMVTKWVGRLKLGSHWMLNPQPAASPHSKNTQKEKHKKTFEQIQIPENTQKEENDTKQTWPNRAVPSACGKA